MLVDLRSDTVTKPTNKMRAAMASAVVGDDVFGEDPTVNELERVAAQMAGKQSALFVPSGTMGNQICVKTNTKRGDEIILEYGSHIRKYEQGGAALMWGCGFLPVKSENGDGIMTPEQVEDAIRSDDIHEPRTGLICVENATSRGCVYPMETLRRIYETGQKHGIPVHMDGARLFNAAAHLDCEAREITRFCDSVMFCVSKGLGAPVGSMVAGSADFIKEARRTRKLMGGGMRQAGIIAAAGLLALTENVRRLSEDNENAQYLSGELKKLGFRVFDTQTNILFFDCGDIIKNDELCEKLKLQGVLCSDYGKSEIRMVTNLGVDRSLCEYAVEAVRQAIKKK